MSRRSLCALTAYLILQLAFGIVIAGDITDLNAGRQYIHPSHGNTPAPLPLRAAAPGETFHNGATLFCSQCHVMHASEQHPNTDQTLPDPFGPFPQNFAQSKFLLKASDPVALCLACHDNVAGIPDVVGADVNGLSDRSAGQFELPGTDNPRGHKLDYGLVTGPDFELCMRCHFGGTFATASVTCIDCHNPHGNDRPRNLQWASYPGGEPPLGLIEDPSSSGMARYEAANVGYGTTNDENLREVTTICIDCHHAFSGANYVDPDGNGFHNRHPSYDSERGSMNNIAQGAIRGTTMPAHWESGTGAGFQSTPRLRYVNSLATDFTSSKVVDADINGVFCLTCHKAHGGTKAFGLLWDPASGINGEGCDQCHAKTVL